MFDNESITRHYLVNECRKFMLPQPIVYYFFHSDNIKNITNLYKNKRVKKLAIKKVEQKKKGSCYTVFKFKLKIKYNTGVITKKNIITVSLVYNIYDNDIVYTSISSVKYK